MDDIARTLKLQDLKAIQLHMLEMVSDMGEFWTQGLEAPKGGRLSDFLANIAISLAMIDEVLESDAEDMLH